MSSTVLKTRTAMNTEHEKYMREALKEARRAEAEGEIPIGAVVVCEGRIIARAHNQTETLHDPTAHAEMLAMTAATAYIGGKYLPECTLYVTVEPCSPSLLHPRTKVCNGVLSEECSAIMTEFFKKIRR